LRPDADTQVQRISLAIEQVLGSDGWVNGAKIYDRRHLRKIAESMARKTAEPSRFVNQGFHNTSITECIMRQELETDPAAVVELVASIVTTGRAEVGQLKSTGLVTVDSKSLALDLESRWATDESAANQGLRDPVGQIFDLTVTQAFWDLRSDDRLRYIYTQEAKPRTGTTGERLIKVDTKTNSRIEVTYEGAKLTIKDAFEISRMFNRTQNGLIVHSTIVSDLNEPSITDAEQLSKAISGFHSASARPPVLIVFAGLLPGAADNSKGFDLHAVTVLQIEDTYFLESRWGMNADMHLNGLTADELLHAMTLPQTFVQEEFDTGEPPYMRVIDPSYPTPRSARAPQHLAMQRENEQILEIEKRAQNNPSVQAQEKYFEELEKWEAKRSEHLAIFGEDLPFTVPAPKAPSTQSV